MGKTKIICKYLLLILMVLSKMDSYSQDLLTKELLWVGQDSIERITFSDKSQIIEWGKAQLPFSYAFSKDFSSNGIVFNVVLVYGCSGLPCLNIYVFTEKKGAWYLIAKTNARLTEQLMVDVDSKYEKIIFKTKSSQIGELPFDELVLKHNETE